MNFTVRFIFSLFIFNFILLTNAYSAEDEFKNISSQELKQLLDSGKDFFLLNPLPNIIFRQGYIPSSVNIRWHSLKDSPLLPKNKNTLIVTYCMGPK